MIEAMRMLLWGKSRRGPNFVIVTGLAFSLTISMTIPGLIDRNRRDPVAPRPMDGAGACSESRLCTRRYGPVSDFPPSGLEASRDIAYPDLIVATMGGRDALDLTLWNPWPCLQLLRHLSRNAGVHIHRSFPLP
jgi:hypothetical protein